MRITALEKDVADAVHGSLEEHSMMLQELGLRAEFRGVRIVDAAEASRTSEIEIEFYRDSDFVDIFEFFIMRSGVSITSAYEATEWMAQQLAEFPIRHARH